MIHLGVQAPCCRSYYCFHSLWQHNRCTGLTIQMVSIWSIIISLIPVESPIWILHLKNRQSYTENKYTASVSMILLTNPPHPPSSSSIITKDTWNDGQEHSTSAETGKSAVKRLYWPPHLTCLDSLRQSTPATSFPVQVRNTATRDKDNDSHRDKEENQTFLPWPKKTLLNESS